MPVGVVVEEARSSQTIFRAPKAWRSAASACASVQPLRLALSRVSRVARMVPSPSCSMAPPSSTKSNLRTGVPARRAISSPTVASSGRSNLPPQPLVLNLSATAPSRFGRRSGRYRAARYRHSGRERARPRRRARARADASASAPATSRRTRLDRPSARTSAATSRRGLARSPFHSSGSAGQAVQIAFCGAHSGGTEMAFSGDGSSHEFVQA